MLVGLDLKDWANAFHCNLRISCGYRALKDRNVYGSSEQMEACSQGKKEGMEEKNRDG